MRNAVTERYRQELTEEIKAVKDAVLRGVTSFEEYQKLTGKIAGLETAERVFNEVMNDTEKNNE